MINDINLEKLLKQIEKVKRNNKDIEQVDQEILKKCTKLVQNKGLVLLNPMDKKQIARTLNLIHDCPNIVATIIKDDNKKRIVLRYINLKSNNIEIYKLIDLANQAYIDRDFEKCIEYYLQVITMCKRPRAIAYGKIGLSYMKLGKFDLAIDYLIVSQGFSKKEGLDLDFQDLIIQLRGNRSKIENKRKFKMDLDFFNSDIEDFYGIDNFIEINNYFINSNLDFNSACSKLNLSPENINIIKLIYAREYYLRGYIEIGDTFFNVVLKSKDKTKKVIKLMEIIRKNKLFYQNREVSFERKERKLLMIKI